MAQMISTPEQQDVITDDQRYPQRYEIYAFLGVWYFSFRSATVAHYLSKDMRCPFFAFLLGRAMKGAHCPKNQTNCSGITVTMEPDGLIA